MIGQDLLRHNVGRHQAGDHRCARDRRPANPAEREQWRERRMQMLPTAFGEVAGEDPQQLVEVGAQRAVGRLLNSQVFEHRHAVGSGDATDGSTDQFLVDTTALRVVGHRHLPQQVPDGLGAVDVIGQKFFIAKAFLHQHRGHRRQAPCVRSWTYPQMEIGHLGCIGDHRIDDDHRARRILGDLVEHRAGTREALRHPRVLTDEDGHLGVLELAPGVPAVQVRVDPRFSGFLLRQRIRPVAGSDAP